MSKTFLKKSFALLVAALLVGGFFAAQGIALAVTGDEPTTLAANNITTTDATLHGTNGASVADTDGEGFWWGQSPVVSFMPCTSDCANQLPGDWSTAIATTKDLAANGAFDLNVTGLTPSTTYHFVAWSSVGGTWSPGSVLDFPTATPTPVGPGPDCSVSALGSDYSTIQDAIDDTNCTTITVAAGTYEGFSVENRTGLTITGAGIGSTTITPSTLIDTNTGHKYDADMQVSVFVNNSTDITLKNLTIGDNGQTPGAGGPNALVFWNASSGTLSDSEVKGTYTISGAQTGQGIAVDAGSGETTDLTIDNVDISGFQKNGIEAIDGNGSTSAGGTITLDVKDGSINGAGAIGTIAQNGILAWNRGTGSVIATVDGTSISNMQYTDPLTALDTAILVFGTAEVSSISNVDFTNVDLYIDTEPGNGPIDATSGNTFDGVTASSATGTQLASIEDKIGDIMSDDTLQPVYILPNTLIVTMANLGIQSGLDVANSGDTILVTPGTYTGSLSVATSDLTLKGKGAVVLNVGAGYGIDINGVTGFTLSDMTVNASTSTTYILKAYKADGITVKNVTFDGGTGNTGGGADFNTTNDITLDHVTANGFHKNGFALTSQYDTADAPADGISFKDITASNNGWTGIAFYTVGNAGGSASINDVTFTGTNIISGNGAGSAAGAGVFIEGDSDSNLGLGTVVPANKVTSNGTTLELGTIAFNGNSHNDILNYQTAPVNALNATFGGLTGSSMTPAQRTTEDGLIYDVLDKAFLGKVTYYTPDTTAPVITILGANPMDVTVGTVFTDPGATANDNVDGSVTVQTSGTVDTNTEGTYTITYSATDAAGNNSTATRTVNVVAVGDNNENGGGRSHRSSGGSSSGNNSEGEVLGASTGPIEGCDARTTGFSIVTGESCATNSGAAPTSPTSPASAGQVLGAEKFTFSLFLQQGSNGNEVMELQKFLNAAGYGTLVVDGKFGPMTHAAVVKFQLANGLKGDGIVGPLTRAALNK